ncbi:MAG: START domain-containing protein [Bacteroidetes bacterium]|nr:START domain-containing protein [Bacteroidota bacterium]
MILLKKTFLSLFLFFIFSFGAAQHKATDWELKKCESGISVYTRYVSNSSFKELKSIAIVKTSLSGIIALLNDFESYPQWVYKCGEASELKKTNDTTCWHYQTVIAPWPVSNRDFIVKVVQSQNQKTKTITLDSDGTPKEMPIKKNHVRIMYFKATWVLVPLKDGYVQVNYQLLVDPGGAAPAWIVNLAVVDGPFETMIGFKKMLTQEKYQKAKYAFVKELKN